MTRRTLALCAGRHVSVIGGTALFAATLPVADALIVTEIHQDYAGDTWFPDWDRGQWRVARKEEAHAPSGGVRFDYVTYERA